MIACVSKEPENPILGYPTLVYSNSFKLATVCTVHAQLINFNMAVIIRQCVNSQCYAALWIIHCGAEEKEPYVHYQSSVNCYSLQWRYRECQGSY